MHPVVIIGGLAIAAWAWTRRDQDDAGDVATSQLPGASGEPPADAWPLEGDQVNAVIDAPSEFKLPEEARGSAVWAVPDKSWPELWGDFVWIQHPTTENWFVRQSALAELLKGAASAEV